MSSPYIPISCDFHDELLAAATIRRPVELTVAVDDGEIQHLSGRIEDVYTRDRAEVLRLDGGTVIRLDWIVALDGKSPPEPGE